MHFLSRGDGYTLFLAPTEAVLSQGGRLQLTSDTFKVTTDLSLKLCHLSLQRIRPSLLLRQCGLRSLPISLPLLFLTGKYCQSICLLLLPPPDDRAFSP